MEDKALNRPFSKDILQAAKELAIDFHVTIEKNEELVFFGYCTEMPTVMNDGKTESECIDNVREAIRVVISYMLETNMEIPQPEIFSGNKYASVRKVAGMEIFKAENGQFYMYNTDGSSDSRNTGNIWSTGSVRILKILHENLGEFIKEVEDNKEL